MSERPGTIRLPARDITVPSTLSQEAQAVLANPPAESFDSPAPPRSRCSAVTWQAAAGSTRSRRTAGCRPTTRSRPPAKFLLYAVGHDLRHPCLSPLNGDFSKGFPPAILTTGTRDMLLSDTVLLHRALRRAGIPAELHVTEAGGHGGFMGRAPEDQEILSEVRRFADTHWAR